jgi:hypothetical protein
MKQETFTIRAYGKSELALLYSPELTKDAALKRLRNWGDSSASGMPTSRTSSG